MTRVVKCVCNGFDLEYEGHSLHGDLYKVEGGWMFLGNFDTDNQLPRWEELRGRPNRGTLQPQAEYWQRRGIFLIEAGGIALTPEAQAYINKWSS